MSYPPIAAFNCASRASPVAAPTTLVSSRSRAMRACFAASSIDIEPGSCHASQVIRMVRPKPYKAERVAISAWADGGRIESPRSHGIEANSGLATPFPMTSDTGRRGSLEVLADASCFSRKSGMGRRGFINSAGVGRRAEQGVQLLAQTV